MTIIELPVSSFSKKVLLSEFGTEPISLSSRSVANQILSYKPIDPRSNLNTLRQLLDCSVQIIINNKYAKRISGHSYQIGYHLFNNHMERMLEWTYSARLVGVPARIGIRNFYNLHQIEEDDFQLESAYKRWQRYWEGKKSVKVAPKVGNFKEHNGFQNCPVLKVIVPPSDSKLNRFVYEFIIDNNYFFTRTDGRFSEIRFNQFKAYVYNKIGQVPIKALSKKWKWDIRTTYKRINRFEEILVRDVEFSENLGISLNKHFSSFD